MVHVQHTLLWLSAPLHGIKRMLLAAAGCLAASTILAQVPQKFPTKPIRFMVPYTAGGGTDTMARVIAQK